MAINLAKLKKLPEHPGVYFFLGKRKKILYIGKATSLRDRVRSYFSNDLLKTRSPLIAKMVEEAVTIDYKTTDSVLEALMLEADLIKKFQPYYNTEEKDDKSNNCVVITDEDFPQVLVIRKKDVKTEYFGPYPHGMQLKEALKIIRKIFPYRDAKCIPAEDQIKRGKTPRACFNRQIGLCPGVCTGEVSKKEYAKTVRNLKLFFEGKKSALLKNLQKQMREYAKSKEFEKAGEVKNKIFAINHIQDISLIKNNRNEETISSEKTFRVESYDIAHLAGKEMVGAMIVLENGQPNKADYRKFRIRDVKTVNDVASLAEVLRRRINHSEWKMPDLVVLDGSTAQLNIAKKIIPNIPLVAVVKNESHKPERIIGDMEMAISHEKEILLANAEVHRFVSAFHRRLRSKNWLR